MPDHSGHRERHRKLVISKLHKSLNKPTDAELLELALYAVDPRGDTRPLAEELLSRCGGLDGIFSRPMEELCAKKGVGENTAFLLALIGELSRRTEWAFSLGPRITDPEAAFSYMRGRLAGLIRDTAFFMCLDGNRHVLKCSAIDSPLVPEHLYRFAADTVKAHSRLLILCRAYPEGDPQRDEEEIGRVLTMSKLLGRSGITLLDFILYSSDKYISIAREGLFPVAEPRREEYCPTAKKPPLSPVFPTSLQGRESYW